MRETARVRTMALVRQVAMLNSLAEEATLLTADVARCHERVAGSAWSETRTQALGQLDHFHRRLRSIGLRRSELAGR